MKKTNKNRKIILVFYTLIIIFVILIAYFFSPLMDELKRTFFIIAAVMGLALLILGIVLIWLTKKSKIRGKLRLFLILTGISAIFPLIGAVLHNFFYAIRIYFEEILIVKIIMQFLEAVSFILALLICPILFIISAIVIIILLHKKKK